MCRTLVKLLQTEVSQCAPCLLLSLVLTYLSVMLVIVIHLKSTGQNKQKLREK